MFDTSQAITINNNKTTSVVTMITPLYKLNNESLSFNNNNNNGDYFGCINDTKIKNDPLHIIDHGSVLYLICTIAK